MLLFNLKDVANGAVFQEKLEGSFGHKTWPLVIETDELGYRNFLHFMRHRTSLSSDVQHTVVVKEERTCHGMNVLRTADTQQLLRLARFEDRKGLTRLTPVIRLPL